MIVYLFYVVLGLGAFLWLRKSKEKGKESYLIPGVPKGTVVLHQYGPAPHVPSISPFVMKLETYLRATKIPYVNQYDRKPGPKGKIPWIQYNDDVIPDSQRVVEFLNKEFKVDLNKKLTNEQMAVGHVVRRMAEEWLYWVLVMFRVIFEPNGTVYRQLGLPSIIIWYMRRAAKPRLLSQGIGRHSRQEVTSMMNDDLAAIDVILGNKKYIFGDSSDDVTEFDCALFGQLCQLIWQMPDCGVEELVQDKYPRLVSYCQRMKVAFWPDWESRLKKIQPTKETPKTSASSSSLSSTSSSSPLSSPPLNDSPSSNISPTSPPPPTPSSSLSSSSLSKPTTTSSTTAAVSSNEVTCSYSRDTNTNNEESHTSTNAVNDMDIKSNHNSNAATTTTTTTTTNNNNNINISSTIIPNGTNNKHDITGQGPLFASTRKRLIVDQGTQPN